MFIQRITKKKTESKRVILQTNLRVCFDIEDNMNTKDTIVQKIS